MHLHGDADLYALDLYQPKVDQWQEYAKTSDV